MMCKTFKIAIAAREKSVCVNTRTRSVTLTGRKGPDWSKSLRQQTKCTIIANLGQACHNPQSKEDVYGSELFSGFSLVGKTHKLSWWGCTMSDSPLEQLKAIDEMSGKIFIPALIISSFVEVGPWFASYQKLHLAIVYFIFVMLGFLGSVLILIFLGWLNNCFDDVNVQPVVSVAIMPVGIMVAFPQHFPSFHMPLSPVTGVSILIWSFFLLKDFHTKKA